MKKQSGLFAPITLVHIENITAVVKETLALKSSPQVHKIFNAADLWNIHRQKKGPKAIQATILNRTLKYSIMKKQSHHLFNLIAKQDLTHLTSFVDETLSFATIEEHKKIFTTADLWKIQQQKKMYGKEGIFYRNFFPGNVLQVFKILPYPFGYLSSTEEKLRIHFY